MKSIRRMINGTEERTLTGTGRPVQFDNSFGRIYGARKLGNLNEVPTYRFDGGYKAESMIRPDLTTINTAVDTENSMFQSFYS